MGAVALIIAGVLVYINIEGPKTEVQKKSLEIIRKISNRPPGPDAFTGELPSQKPEIYEDRLGPESYSTPEEKL